MHPTIPESFNHCSADLPNGHVYHYVDQSPPNHGAVRGTCLLLHGFPDLWYGWRYQIQALTGAGFRCIVPSTLGYATTSKPEDIAAYGFKAMSSDLDALLKFIGIDEPVLLFGHDWGGVLAWRFAAYYPARVRSIAVISTPYAPPAQNASQWADIETLVKTRLPNFGYQAFFASGQSHKIIERNLSAFFGFIFGEPKIAADGSAVSSGDDWTELGVLQKKLEKLDAMEDRSASKQGRKPASKPEVDYYTRTFTRHGIRYPLIYYQTRRVSFDEELESKLPLQFPPSIPALFLTGSADAALPLAMSERSHTFFQKGQYERKILQGADHWLLQRAKTRDRANEILVNWACSNSQARTSVAKL